MAAPFCIIGGGGQIGKDVDWYLSHKNIKYHNFKAKLRNNEDVFAFHKEYSSFQIVNFAFDRSLEDRFTNVQLPKLLEDHFVIPPIHFSSNAVYGIQKKTVKTGDSLDAFNLYASEKISAESSLVNSIVIRGSFLSSHHKIFRENIPKVHLRSMWNGITSFELASHLVLSKFKVGINTIASKKHLCWKEIADYFEIIVEHDESIINNQCILQSDICDVAPIFSQFDFLKAFLQK